MDEKRLVDALLFLCDRSLWIDRDKKSTFSRGSSEEDVDWNIACVANTSVSRRWRCCSAPQCLKPGSSFLCVELAGNRRFVLLIVDTSIRSSLRRHEICDMSMLFRNQGNALK